MRAFAPTTYWLGLGVALLLDPLAARRALAQFQGSRTPVPVSGNLTFQSISLGLFNACGLTTTGAVYCWGGSPPDPTPRELDVDMRLTSLVGRKQDYCGLAATGAAYCWGANDWGQLGDGSKIASGVVAVAGGLSFRSITVGWEHTCAVATSGAAYCWGRNGRGELGDGTWDDRLTPRRVVGGFTFASLTAGYGHTCGLTTGGAALCWGSNRYGILGIGDTTDHASPVPVAGGHRFRFLSAGASHTCGVVTGPQRGTWCWGHNRKGELGNGSHRNSWVPALVAGGPQLVSLSGGENMTCGLTAAGAAYCWGRNDQGQLGSGSGFASPVPVAVAGGLAFASLAAGAGNVCGVRADGRAYCWGNHDWGQLGTGSPLFRGDPGIPAMAPGARARLEMLGTDHHFSIDVTVVQMTSDHLVADLPLGSSFFGGRETLTFAGGGQYPWIWFGWGRRCNLCFRLGGIQVYAGRNRALGGLDGLAWGLFAGLVGGVAVNERRRRRTGHPLLRVDRKAVGPVVLLGLALYGAASRADPFSWLAWGVLPAGAALTVALASLTRQLRADLGEARMGPADRLSQLALDILVIVAAAVVAGLGYSQWVGFPTAEIALAWGGLPTAVIALALAIECARFMTEVRGRAGTHPSIVRLDALLCGGVAGLTVGGLVGTETWTTIWG